MSAEHATWAAVAVPCSRRSATPPSFKATIYHGGSRVAVFLKTASKSGQVFAKLSTQNTPKSTLHNPPYRSRTRTEPSEVPAAKCVVPFNTKVKTPPVPIVYQIKLSRTGRLLPVVSGLTTPTRTTHTSTSSQDRGSTYRCCYLLLSVCVSCV